MPSPKPQVLYATRGTSLAQARADVQPDINRLLTASNYGRQQPRIETFRFEIDAHRALLAYCRTGEMIAPPGWPRWALIALVNIDSNVRRSAVYHLRQCRFCADWMLVKNAGREMCNRTACATEAARLRRRASREASDNQAGRTRRRRRSRRSQK